MIKSNIILSKITLFLIPVMVLMYGSVPAQETVTDIDGNVYNTITIGTQTWLQENLKVLHNPDGSSIDNVYSYGNNPANVDVYGRLYFWDAAMNNSTTEKAQGICPDNWHIPSFAEWNTLSGYLGGSTVAGGKMKEEGTSHWNQPNSNATNSSGFTALPAGEKDHDGFQLLHEYAVIWSSTQATDTWSKYFYLSYQDAQLHPYEYFKDFAYSVRCIKDPETGTGELDGNGIKVYPNPCQDHIRIESTIDQTRDICASIISHTGAVIHQFRASGSQHTLGLEFLAPGFYILRIETKEKVYQKQFVKL